MQLIEKNGKIYLRADFANLDDSEHNFMRDLTYRGIWWGEFDEDGDSPLVEFETETPVSLSTRYEIIERRAIGVATLTDSVKAIFQAQKQTAKAWQEEQTAKHFRIEKLQNLVNHAFSVREDGCKDCLHLRLEYGEYVCKYTNKRCYKHTDEAELEFYAQREARIIGVDNWYWARPFPVPGCEVLLKGRQAELDLQEIKEKEGK